MAAPISSSSSRVLIYDAVGTDSTCVLKTLEQIRSTVDGRRYQVETFSSRPDAFDSPESVGLLVIPGGNYVAMESTLFPIASKVREAVTKVGTSYLGVCAGAIAASEEFSCGFDRFEADKLTKATFDPYAPLEGKMHLKLYPGKCFFLHKAGGDPSAESMEMIATSEKVKPFSLYFHTGCFFPSAEKHESTSVILRYEKYRLEGESSTLAGAIFHQSGKGKVVLSGVHPEIGPKAARDSIPPRMHPGIVARYHAAADKLEASKMEQERTMRMFLDKLDIATMAE